MSEITEFLISYGRKNYLIRGDYVKYRCGMDKAAGKNGNGFVPVNLTLTVITRVVAPWISDFRKAEEISRLLDCYRKVYPDLDEDEVKLIQHIDRAFKRSAMCVPWISASVISSAIKEVTGDKTVNVRGIIFVDPKLIGVYAEYRPTGLEVYEYIREGSVITSRMLINKKIEGSFTTSIGAKRQKGYGQVRIELSY